MFYHGLFMLYVVGTPIGNLDDLSLRQAKTLLSSQIILSEDTRSTHFLLKKAGELLRLPPPADIKLISYYKEKELEKLPQILEWLHQEKIISLISQAGMPLISDPGYLLIKQVIKEQLPLTVIPGPSAITTALIYTGYNLGNFCFLGFVPKKQGDFRQLLGKLAANQTNFPEMLYVFFESPHRINKTLKTIDDTCPQAKITIARELTKKFEEISRGTAQELLTKTYKGEITLLLRF